MFTSITLITIYLLHGLIVAAFLGALGAFSDAFATPVTRRAEIAITIALWPVFVAILLGIFVFAFVETLSNAILRTLR